MKEKIYSFPFVLSVTPSSKVQSTGEEERLWQRSKSLLHEIDDLCTNERNQLLQPCSLFHQRNLLTKSLKKSIDTSREGAVL